MTGGGYGLRTAQPYRSRRLQFSGALTHRITVSPDAQGRPGETFMAPSLSPYLGRVHKKGSRSDCVVLLSRRGSMLLVVCLRPAHIESLPDDAASTVTVLERIGTCIEEPTETVLLGEPALRYMIEMRDGRVLTEWKLDHDGWRFAIGLFLSPEDGKEQLNMGMSVLGTWRWLSASSPAG